MLLACRMVTQPVCRQGHPIPFRLLFLEKSSSNKLIFRVVPILLLTNAPPLRPPPPRWRRRLPLTINNAFVKDGQTDAWTKFVWWWDGDKNWPVWRHSPQNDHWHDEDGNSDRLFTSTFRNVWVNNTTTLFLVTKAVCEYFTDDKKKSAVVMVTSPACDDRGITRPIHFEYSPKKDNDTSFFSFWKKIHLSTLTRLSSTRLLISGCGLASGQSARSANLTHFFRGERHLATPVGNFFNLSVKLLLKLLWFVTATSTMFQETDKVLRQRSLCL